VSSSGYRAPLELGYQTKDKR